MLSKCYSGALCLLLIAISSLPICLKAVVVPRALISRSLCSSWRSVRRGMPLMRREAVNRQVQAVMQEQAVRQVQGRGVGVDRGRVS